MFRIALLAAGCLLWGHLLPLSAQEDTPHRSATSKARPTPSSTQTSAVRGTIVKVDVPNHLLTLKTALGKEQEFRLTDHTRFRRPDPQSPLKSKDEAAPLHGSLARIAPLPPGTRVILMVNPPGEGGTVEEILLETPQ